MPGLSQLTSKHIIYRHVSAMQACWVQTSEDAERSLLVKLKTECGYQFTSKLESMFTDIKTSRDTMMDYKSQDGASTSSSSDLDLSVQVCYLFSQVCPA